MNEQLQTDQAGLVAEFTQLMLHKADEAAQQWMAAEILRVPPVIASTILMDQSLRDYRAFLPQIEVPALVLFGEDDKLTSPRAGEYIAGQIRGARLRTFPQSSHCPFWEEPDDFNAAVAEFVTGLALSGASRGGGRRRGWPGTSSTAATAVTTDVGRGRSVLAV